MSGIGEGLAELGQGAAIASAAQPGYGAGSADAGHTHESSCLNCGTQLLGSHCHACGQPAHVHRTLAAFFHDLLHGVFHFEGRIWRTLPLLAWQPGRLTREYIDGKRASYVSPIALFLFVVFLMFAVFHATEDHAKSAVQVVGGQNAAQNIQRLQARMAKAERRRTAAIAQGSDTDDLDIELEVERQTLNALRGDVPKAANDGIDKSSDFPKLPQLEQAIRKFKANPELASYKLQTYAYKYSWALIPISVPFLWLLFPFSRRFRLYDHTVFVTYSLCFMTLLLIAAMIAGAVGAQAVAALLFFVPPFHMYRQLRVAYGLGPAAASVRAVLLVIFAALALGLFFVMIMAQTSL